MKVLIFILFALFTFQICYTDEIIGLQLSENIDNILEVVNFPDTSSTSILTTLSIFSYQWFKIDYIDFAGDSIGQQAFSFGAQWVISQLVGEQVITVSDGWEFSPLIIYKSDTNQTIYRFNTEFTNKKAKTFMAEFAVYNNDSIENLQYLTGTYDIDLADDSIATLEYSVVSLKYNEGNIWVAMEVPALFNANSDADGGEDWSNLDIEKDITQNIQKLQEEGAKFTIKKGIEDGTLRSADWRIMYTTRIQKQIAKGTNYRFAVVLGDGVYAYYLAECEYFVHLDSAGKSSVVSSGCWRISTFVT